MKWDRVWIFFVIIAIGLALSWGKVGQNTREDMGSEDFLLLRAEANCRLPGDTCAAYLSDMALVAKAASLSDARLGLYFKLVGVEGAGIDTGSVEAFTVELIREPEPPVSLAVLRRPEDWQAVYGGKVLRRAQVRVSFKRQGIRYVAEYPLVQAAAQ